MIWIASSSILGGRPTNEDRVYAACSSLNRAQLVVADGMGGHDDGEIAAQIAVDTVRNARDATPADAAQRAHQAVVRAARAKRSNMGTTLTIGSIRVGSGGLRGTVSLAHVGDTRLYVIRGDRVARCTQDQTLPDGSLIQAVGIGDALEIEARTLTIRPEDRVVLLSDGAWGVLPDADLASLVRGDDPRAIAHAVVRAALARKTRDNATCAIAWFTE